MANRLNQISTQLVTPPMLPSANDIQYMCRICSNYEVSINAFSELGKLLSLEHKVKTCLRVELNESGPYPNNVCMNCLGKVNISYELHLQATATQEKISTILVNAGLPKQSNMFQSNGISHNSKCSPVIESVTSLVSNPYIVSAQSIKTEPQQNHNVSILANPSDLLTKSSLISPAKRVASPDETPSKKERKTVCSTCGEWFFKSELAAHTRQVHQSVKLVFGCVNCSANFTTQEELTQHSEQCS